MWVSRRHSGINDRTFGSPTHANRFAWIANVKRFQGKVVCLTHSMAEKRSPQVLDDLQNEATIERRRTSPARPGSRPATRDADATSRTFVDITMGAMPYRTQRRTNVLQCGASKLGNPVGNAIVAMFGMAPSVTIKVVSHMYEFFGHNDFKCARSIKVYAIEMDQDCMALSATDERVCAAVGGRYLAAKPFGIDEAIGRDPQVLGRQLESIDIALDERGDVFVTLIQLQKFRLQRLNTITANEHRRI